MSGCAAGLSSHQPLPCHLWVGQLGDVTNQLGSSTLFFSGLCSCICINCTSARQPAVDLPAHLECLHLFLLLLSITNQKICAIFFFNHSYIRGKVLLQMCSNNLECISNSLISASALFDAVCRLVCFSGFSVSNSN